MNIIEHNRFLKLKHSLDDANAKIAELQAMVDKLPKTADGVPITPGMEVFLQFRGGYTMQTQYVMNDLHIGSCPPKKEAGTYSWYSTIEAAEKAKGKVK